MGRYGEALGLWELRIGGFDKDLKPIKGDNLRLMRIMTEAKKKNDEGGMLQQLNEFIKEMIARDYPPHSDEEKQELDIYVEFNLMGLIKELLVAFRWTNREQLEKLGSDELKKVMLQSPSI